MTTTAAETTIPKTALVTGGNRGLGRSSALHLAAAGVDVILTYRSHPEEAEAVVDQIRETGRQAAALQLDTGQPETFPAFAETVRSTLTDAFGRTSLDILVNNAGHSLRTPIGETRLEDVRSLLDIHIVGTVMLTEALLPLLADGGRIVNTSSGLARFTGDGSSSVYAAAKGAVEVYTRYLAKELGPRRITVNTVAPGVVGTDFGGGTSRDNEQVREHLSALIAMGRVGEPDDIGAAVASITSDAMGWVTGQRIEASGGMLL
ncbi:SDR family oxidoreductase [Arthrobacter rhombi]|uniref:SDR family NAD(P)-dependent oxidoreductase n=1 Tax=Arthrobacter rhombi TaxID=71253 RepID=UPI0031D843A5